MLKYELFKSNSDLFRSFAVRRCEKAKKVTRVKYLRLLRDASEETPRSPRIFWRYVKPNIPWFLCVICTPPAGNQVVRSL